MRHSLNHFNRFVKTLLAVASRRLSLTALALALCCGSVVYFIVRADSSAQTLPFSQNWTNTGLITTNDDWSGVAGIEGFLGDRAASGTTADIDPQTIVEPLTTIDVIANQTNPNTNTAGGVAEFHTTLQSTPQQTIALQGSGTADHPNIIIYLNTTGQTGINVSYNLRDIDCSVDNAQQQVALQYRVGSSGNFTNLPTGYVADATARVNGAAADVANCTLVTPISVTLPAAADNQPLVQVRIITSNAAGSDEWVGIDDISVATGPVVDTAPSVMSTSPADNATGVAVASNLSVTFSEAVNAPAGAFSISCAMSGAHTFALSGGPTTFTLNPDTDFSQNEVCTVTVAAAQVTDVDAIDPPDNMAANFVFDFTTINLGSCGSAFTPIYTIQGSGTASPSVGASVTTEGVVVGDFQGANNLKGFYIQDSTGDANTATSDGIYIFDGNAPAVDVAVGDRVRITGTVSEAFNNTQVNPAVSIVVCSTGNPLPAATAVDLPEPVNNDLERYENMLVVFPETLTVTGNFGLGRFGELVLSSDGRLFQQNNFDRTNSAGALATADLNQRRYVVLDDGLSIQNPDPTPYYDANNTRRVGDTTTGLQGVLTFDFSEYRVQPTTAPVFVSANPRTAAPSPVGGNVKASSFNVLNYFNGNGDGTGFPTSRGATTLAEFNRQRNKIIAAILAINADVYGIIEVENDGNGAASAIQDLVNGLNVATAAGTYAFREGTTPGTDAIKNSIIYKTTTVTPDGAAVNDTDPIFTGQARNPLAQTFTLNSNGQKFVFIVNHFTSKGCSASDTGLDADLGDGQGCDNLQRTLQAEALLDFVEERQTTTGVARVLVMGDLNAYGEEDPIFRLEDDASDRLMDGPGGLIDLVQNFIPAADRYSYQFGNYSGYLDHALATKELASFVSGATIWHINADEPTILDYNVEFKSPAQQALNVGTPYRASDHDPVIVGLNLVCMTITVSPLTLPSGTYNLAYNLPLAASGGSGTYTLALQAGSSLPMGLTLSTAGVISGTPTQPGATTFTVIATDTVTGCTGNRTYTIGIQCPTISISPATLTQPVVGAAYNQPLTGSGGVGPYTFALAVGSSLPPGLNLVGSAITGTPTASGPFTFTITVTDTGLAAGPTNCSGNRTYTLTVTLPSCAITISPATIPGAFKGTAYSQTFTAMGATGTVMWSVSTGSLPAGLMLSPAGVLSGTPIAAGNFTFTVRASDANNCVTTQSYMLAVHVETAAIADPLACTGPGNLVNVTATVTNNAAIAQAASFTATLQPPLQPNLLAVPGTCVASVGLCSVVSPSIVSWAGTLAARQTVTINYQAQVSDGVLPGTQLCVTSVATVGNSVPATVTACGLANCPVIGPGTLPAATSPVSDQKAGSVLIYNVYTSSTNPIQQNTRISLTNVNPTLSAFVHLFFVDGTSCSVADSILCLTPNQTTSFLASDLDPGSTGYIVAVAVDANGCPTNFNFLIGDEYVKFASGHAANLGAEAITAIAGGLPFCNSNSVTAQLNFDGVSYNPVPRVLAIDNIPPRADGNDTLLILNRVGGNLAVGASTLINLFGILYDDSENALSFGFGGSSSSPGTCQFRSSLSNVFPRVTPRFEQFIPAGRSGWAKIFSQADIGLLGAVINFNPNAGTAAGAFNQGHNLHKLTLTTTSNYVIPVFPPGC